MKETSKGGGPFWEKRKRGHYLADHLEKGGVKKLRGHKKGLLDPKEGVPTTSSNREEMHSEERDAVMGLTIPRIHK